MLYRNETLRSLVLAIAYVSLLILTIGLSTAPASSLFVPPDVTWQEIAPEGEEFSVLMPLAPRVSHGTRYFYLDRHLVVNFAHGLAWLVMSSLATKNFS